MSRVGRKPIPIPRAVQVALDGQTVSAKGPKGQLSVTVPDGISMAVEGEQLVVGRAKETEALRMQHGLARSLVANAIRGVEHEYCKELELVGVGYRAQAKGKTLELQIGLSHPVSVPVPEGIEVTTPKPTQIAVHGIDKQVVGQFAANVRRLSPPEPYKGKGIKCMDEVVRRKAGKAAA